jgi:hypothetical protein
MRMLRCGLILALLVTWAGCGGDDTTPVVSSDGNNEKHKDKDAGDDDPSKGRGMLDAGSDAGELPDVDAGGQDPRAPYVAFLAPEPASDPNADTLITTGTVEVKCQVTRSTYRDSLPVDDATVRLEASYAANPENPNKLTVITTPVTAEEGNVYRGEFTLPDDVPNGPIDFTCSGNDSGAPALTGKATLHSLVDLGPAIEIVEPKDESAHATKDEMLIKFRVKPAPAGEDDKEAKPAHIALEVSGQKFDFKADKKDPDTYATTVSFTDTDVFPMTPETADVVVTASSGRTPDAPTRKAISHVTLDDDPPAIAVVSPANQTLVGGTVVLTVKITDAHGVKLSSVKGNINSGLYSLDDWTENEGVYTARFDTGPISAGLSQISIEITAEDELGNANTGVPLELLLDNVPPFVSLDPPLVREITYGSPAKCSAEFDPVGDDATNDRDVVDDSSLYRMMVADETNHTVGENNFHMAEIDPDTAMLFAQGNTEIPLLIDTNDDGICDEINSDLDGADAPLQRTMKALTPTGSAFYSNALSFDEDDPDKCTAGSDTQAHALLCSSMHPAELTRIIAQPFTTQTLPTIYASGVNVNMPGTLACAGETWQLGQALGEGWICLAGRIKDKVGNVGVSAPLRVCVDKAGGESMPCDLDHPPSCVQDCTPPPNFPEGLRIPKR